MGFWDRIFARRRTSESNVRNPSRRGLLNKGVAARVDEDSAMQVSAFNRGLIYVSTQIAKIPWNVKDKEQKTVEGDIYNLLNLSPNPEVNAFMFRLFLVQNAIIHGNSYCEIERDARGTPIALWPLVSKSVEPIRSDSGQLAYKVTPFNAVDKSANNKIVYLNPKDVYHLKNFHTKDAIVGQGVVSYGSETLGIALSADQMAGGIFRNGGIPSGVLEHPGKISDDAYKRLKESWAAQNGGRRSGGTSILEEGVKYNPLNIDPETLQFLQSRQFSVLEVARFLGIPPTKLFDITAATYSNVENANLEVATDTLDAWACNLELEADVKLLNNRFGGRYTELDLYSVFRGDMKTRSDYFKAMMAVGAITPNQIRNLEGMPGYGPDGDEYYIATNNFTPVSRMKDVIDAQIAGKTKPAPASEDPPKEDKSDKKLVEAATKFLLKSK